MRISRMRTQAALAALSLFISAAAGAQAAVPAAWAAQAAAKLSAKPSAKSLPSASPEAWTAILENIRDNGKYASGEAGLPPHFGFDDVQGSTAASHTDDYVTVYGGIGKDDGLFHPVFAGIVSEKWTLLKNGQWRVDQWMFMTGIDGVVRDVAHKTLRVSAALDDLGETDAPVVRGGAAQFAALVARWSKYKAPEAK